MVSAYLGGEKKKRRKKGEDRKAKCSQFESTGELTMSRFVKHYSTVIVGFQLQNQE